MRANRTCENGCSGHGSCSAQGDACKCVVSLNGVKLYTGADCSLKACPVGLSWASATLLGNNDAHPLMECSNRGVCNRDTGECECYPPFEGMACQRNACWNDCNNRGQCLPQKMLAELAGNLYDQPWDSMKIWGCLCDAGYRGPDCRFKECPSGPDPIGGFGNEAGRDCSGRGWCDYAQGLCRCFDGFHGPACNKQSILL